MNFESGQSVVDFIFKELGWKAEHRGDLLIGLPVIKVTIGDKASAQENFDTFKQWAQLHGARVGGFSKDDDGFCCLMSAA